MSLEVKVKWYTRITSTRFPIPWGAGRQGIGDWVSWFLPWVWHLSFSLSLLSVPTLLFSILIAFHSPGATKRSCSKHFQSFVGIAAWVTCHCSELLLIAYVNFNCVLFSFLELGIELEREGGGSKRGNYEQFHINGFLNTVYWGYKRILVCRLSRAHCIEKELHLSWMKL